MRAQQELMMFSGNRDDVGASGFFRRAVFVQDDMKAMVAALALESDFIRKIRNSPGLVAERQTVLAPSILGYHDIVTVKNDLGILFATVSVMRNKLSAVGYQRAIFPSFESEGEPPQRRINCLDRRGFAA